MNARFIPTLAAFATGLALCAPTAGAGEAAQVVAIVTVPKPWYAPQFVVARRMRETIPQYQQLPGLIYKMYSFAQADGQFGGIYLWDTRAEASAWFNPGWFERVRRERGVEGTVRFFDALAVLDGPAGPPTADEHARAVATLALAPAPAGFSRDQLAARFRTEAGAKASEAGRLRSHLVASEDGRVGELTLWIDASAARAALGSNSQAESFDVPILTPAAGARRVAGGSR